MSNLNINDEAPLMVDGLSVQRILNVELISGHGHEITDKWLFQPNGRVYSIHQVSELCGISLSESPVVVLTVCDDDYKNQKQIAIIQTPHGVFMRCFNWQDPAFNTRESLKI